MPIIHDLHTGFFPNEGFDQLLRRTDLNALPRTCKTLRDTSLPKLYRRVEVRFSAGRSRIDALDALENLLSSSGEGLKSTKQLRNLPQRGTLHIRAQIYHSRSHSFSVTFNVFIRQLLKKNTCSIPSKCLSAYFLSFGIQSDNGTKKRVTN